MRKKGREVANWSDTSWTEFVNWDAFVDKIPMAITFGKGAPPVKKTVYVSLWHQHTLEQILAQTKHMFRTETDLTRSMFNTAVVMYYNIFIKNKGHENERIKFFYDTIRSCEEEWVKADMVEAIRHVFKTNQEKRRRKFMSVEKERELNTTLLEKIPPEYKDDIMAALNTDSTGNVYEIGAVARENYAT